MTTTEIYKHLESHQNYNPVWEEPFYTVIEVEGDWKHDHLHTDYLMEQIGYLLHHTETVESDGSDYYTARRYYITKEMDEAIRIFRQFI